MLYAVTLTDADPAATSLCDGMATRGIRTTGCDGNDRPILATMLPQNSMRRCLGVLLAWHRSQIGRCGVLGSQLPSEGVLGCPGIFQGPGCGTSKEFHAPAQSSRRDRFVAPEVQNCLDKSRNRDLQQESPSFLN